MRNFLSLWLCVAALSLLSGCGSKPAEVILYTSVDEPFATPIVREFEKQTGIHVILKTDVEARKTAGLSEKLLAEKSNPQADVWWSNEIFHSINLADQGVLAAYDSPSAADIPAQFKDPQHRWAATAVRVRVLAVAENLPAGVRIESIEDLKNFALKDRIAMAAPSAGTTGGHVAALYTIWGEQKADAYFQSLHDNGVHLLGGNSVVAEMVASGQMLAGLTDNDDVSEAKEQGGNLSAIIPDQRPDQIGTLAMPTSVALVAGAKNPANARKLIDFLLSRQTEKRLIDAHFVLLSVRPDMNAAASPKFMQVDYPAVARMMPQAIQRSTAILEGR